MTIRLSSDSRLTDTANLDVMSHAVNYAQAITELVLNKLDLTGPRSTWSPLIDFGAGKGEYAQRISQQSKRSIVCIEPCNVLDRKYSMSDTIRHCSSLSQLPSDFKAAGAYSLNVLEHIADDVGALNELGLHVKPGGLIFILVPAHRWLWTAMDDAVGHKRRYSRQSLVALCTDAGLLPEQSGTFDCTGLLATACLKGLVWLGIRDKKWNGLISLEEILAFDSVWKVTEPVLAALKLPTGKNVWVLARVKA